MRKVISLLFVFLLLLCLLSGCGSKAPEKPDAPADEQAPKPVPIRYSSVIEISINPLFRLYLDENSVTVRAEALNDDAADVLQGLELVGKSFDESYSEILEESIARDYLVDGRTVEVTLVEVASDFAAMLPEDIVGNAEAIADGIVSAHEIAAEVSVIGDRFEIVAAQAAELLPEGAPAADASEAVSLRCENCNGSGKVDAGCPDCGGDGSLDCPDCGGSGKVYSECEACDNTGLVVCSVCGGSLRDPESCWHCGGSGKCPDCGGTGQDWVTPGAGSGNPGENDGPANTETGWWDSCMYCHGSGVCGNCGGAGGGPCYRCSNAEGDHSHPGYEECPVCGGHVGEEVECGACKGTGTVLCNACGASGRLPMGADCPVCGGSGEVPG